VETKLLDHGYIKLVEAWGSDERIIEAARMSTDKGFQGWPHDERLLRYLWEHKHHTPFEMAGAIVEVQAPIMVFREWHRHRTQSYNELSGRYTQLPDMFYVPSVERLMGAKQSTKNKQGSEEGFTQQEAESTREEILVSGLKARATYEKLLARGVAREVARLVIPVNQYSRMRASANLRNWLAFLTLRCDPSAQWEIRQYANALHEILKPLFPRTMELFDAK
jgi:thymidylate synthase (FAD)